MTVPKTDKLCGALPREDIWSRHFERFDLIKSIENRIRQVQPYEVAIRIHLLDLPSKIADVIFGPAGLVVGKCCSPKIIHEKKSAAIQILSKIDDILGIQFDKTRFAQIREGVFE